MSRTVGLVHCSTGSCFHPVFFSSNLIIIGSLMRTIGGGFEYEPWGMIHFNYIIFLNGLVQPPTRIVTTKSFSIIVFLRFHIASRENRFMFFVETCHYLPY